MAIYKASELSCNLYFISSLFFFLKSKLCFSNLSWYFTVLCVSITSPLVPERVHPPAHRGQEEPDGDHHHLTGVRRLHQRGDTAGHHPPAPRGAGRQRGHRDAAAGSRRSSQHEQQGAACPNSPCFSVSGGEQDVVEAIFTAGACS